MRSGLKPTLRLAGIGVLVCAFRFVDMFGGSIACGDAPVRVRGRVVDAVTGAPIEGAFLLTLSRPEIVEDPERLERLRDTGRMFQEESREDSVRAYGFVGAGRTDATGAFEILVAIGTSRTTGMSGITWHRERGSPYEAARALLVEREGYARLVHPTRDARWEERREGRVTGTLDVGTIRLAR